MQSFPAFFPLEGKRIVIVGAGDAAEAKARLFETAPADVVRVRAGAKEDDFRGAALAFIATEDRAERHGAIRAARAAGVPINVVDHPGFSDFFTPAIVDRGAIVIGVSTSGAAPTLARDLRARIEQVTPFSFERLAAFADAVRARVIRARPELGTRRLAWEAILRGAAGAHALAGDDVAAHEAAERVLQQRCEAAGVVHLVGAGPGDPELLTLRALRLLQDADVVFYDRLVDPRILDLARRDAQRVYVGKERGRHALPQREIEERLIKAAQAGNRVVRLKGGDPFIFGRGGEELEALRRAGVAAYVTPGVTAALGCAAEAGVPLTHREHAQAVTFVTGHAKDGDTPALDWRALNSPSHTVVVYMGVDQGAAIAQNLMAAGRSDDTPVMIVENGTTPQVRRISGTLRLLADGALTAGLQGPGLLIIGDVVRAAHAGAEAAQLETVR